MVYDSKRKLCFRFLTVVTVTTWCQRMMATVEKVSEKDASEKGEQHKEEDHIDDKDAALAEEWKEKANKKFKGK